MTGPTSESINDRTFCWEQISRTNSIFRVSRVFASRDSVDRLLPLYALFSAVEQISSTVSDAGVAVSKLNWWRNECLQKKMSQSQHPIIRELHQSGASDRLPGEQIAGLFNGAEYRLSASASTDMASLRNQCIEIYRPQLELELSVSDRRISSVEFRHGLLACNGLLQLVRESVRRKEQGGFWWIPHNSLARHGVSRGEILGSPDSRNVRKLMTEVLTEGISWGEEAGQSSKVPTVDLSPTRHVFAISRLYRRKLRDLLAIAPHRYSKGLTKLNPTDLFSAWAAARRLS